MLERQRGLAGTAGADWVGYARRAVFGDGSAWRAALRRQSPEALEAGEAIARRAAPFRDAQLSGADLVHMDFGLHNVLFRSGEVAAVVDLEGVGRGRWRSTSRSCAWPVPCSTGASSRPAAGSRRR